MSKDCHCFQDAEAKAKAAEEEQRKAEERFLELQKKAQEQRERWSFLLSTRLYQLLDSLVVRI